MSFDTISSSGANSAIVHYKPKETSSSIINPNQIYLIDSGG
jgi:Xaa-Pro aminopeptidase